MILPLYNIHTFLMYFEVKVEDLQLTVFSFSIHSYSFIVAC